MSKLGKFFRKGGLRRILRVLPAVASIIGGPVGRLAMPVVRVIGLLLSTPKSKPKSVVYGPTQKELRRKHVMEPKKKWYTSKTYGAVATTILSGIFMTFNPELQAAVAQYVGIAFTVVGFVFGILRKVTKQPIE